MKTEKVLSKSVAKGTFDETFLEEGFFILTHKNDNDDVEILEREIDSSYIQFHFCTKGSADFVFNEGRYTLNIKEETSLLLYNPQRDLPIHLQLQPHSWLASLVISIKKFHGLFSEDADYVTFLSDDNRDKKYYKDGKISPSMAVVLNQLISFNLNSSIKQLYYKGKAYELLSLFFNRSEDANIEQCPFLVDEVNVAKLKRAKDIIIANMAEPPSLQELADTIELSLKKLKEGFKQIYGDTVYSFLFDYKMEVARKLLESGENNVNEVGLKVGYSTSSHFIAAFKKKFGTTPKKYIQATS
ncbi:AraC family transcriptional regulator [Winogradskyella sp. SYSU M77433]|uniref:AraC family transcriptional regulator n=1 Tax=Winogradskyella sp. SYSU M77433 TaxID=3042722 RepID=UPI002480DB04|nr:AraC family transcriptional regulator [Winogradskyella sp. SYSU M77433]MDH7913631.1 AraC family transcriptional regulator [Winogradskyella sp. SYSU M77433]|tara:strand:- start:2477 stop:3376 length:900 start_codon:yes stop_codon:yes gene_type:complete